MSAGYCYIWEYEVKPDCEAAFERLYGPEGSWVALFRRADGYQATELHRDLDRPRRYLTVDYWRSAEDSAAFKRDFASECELLDLEGDSLTEREHYLGGFTPAG